MKHRHGSSLALSVRLTNKSSACSVLFFSFFFSLAWVHFSIALACRDKAHARKLPYFPPSSLEFQHTHSHILVFWVECLLRSKVKSKQLALGSMLCMSVFPYLLFWCGSLCLCCQCLGLWQHANICVSASDVG